MNHLISTGIPVQFCISNVCYNLQPPSHVRTRTEEQPVPTTKDTDKDNKDRKDEKENGGWLSTTLGKLIRPKNQMKLPDDKNPSVSEIGKKMVNFLSSTCIDYVRVFLFLDCVGQK